ncbi:hypothetical protein D3C73_1208320 [compost metagenome]
MLAFVVAGNDSAGQRPVLDYGRTFKSLHIPSWQGDEVSCPYLNDGFDAVFELQDRFKSVIDIIAENEA